MKKFLNLPLLFLMLLFMYACDNNDNPAEESSSMEFWLLSSSRQYEYLSKNYQNAFKWGREFDQYYRDFLAQGFSAWDAARLGAYLHGLAGDSAAETAGQESMNASDILHCLHI